jgi:hypothetical protein
MRNLNSTSTLVTGTVDSMQSLSHNTVVLLCPVAKICHGASENLKGTCINVNYSYISPKSSSESLS